MKKIIFYLALALVYPLRSLAEYPELGNGATLTVNNAVVESGTTEVQFAGGVKIASDMGDLSPSLSMSPEQSATVSGMIKIPSDNAHFGKTVGIFAAGFYSPETRTCSGKSEDGQYYMLSTAPVDNADRDDTTWFNPWDKEATRAKTFEEWDGSLASLKLFRTAVELNESVSVPIITNSKFPNGIQGLLCITFGYRVVGAKGINTWVFNETTIDVNFPAANNMLIGQITDPNTDLAFVMTDENQATVIATYGNKDAEGNLTSISGMSMVSVSNPEQIVHVEFDEDNPQEFTVEFPDRSKIKVDNYDTNNKEADFTVIQTDDQGNEKQVGKFEKQPIKLPNKPIREENTLDNFISELRKFSYHMINEIMGMVCDNNSWLVFIKEGSICHPINENSFKETLDVNLDCHMTQLRDLSAILGNLSVVGSLASLGSCKNLLLLETCVEGLIGLGNYVWQQVAGGANGECNDNNIVDYFLKIESYPTDAPHGIENRCIVENNPPSIEGLKEGWNFTYDDQKRKHGLQIYVRSDGRFSAETYKHGVKHGPTGEWLADGTPDYSFNNYKNGVRDGLQIRVRNDGSFEVSERINGLREGLSGSWAADCGVGTSDGSGSAFGDWYHNYVKDKEHGKQIYVWSDGSYFIETYVNGVSEGPTCFFNADGSLKKCE